MPKPQYDPSDLPESLQEICEVIGFEATLKLLQRWAGQRLVIPKRLTLTHDLCFVVGPDEATKLSWAFGGWQLEIPTCRAMKVAARNREIREKSKQMTRSELARKYGLSLRSLRYIVNGRELKTPN